jgi:hypothetical protein
MFTVPGYSATLAEQYLDDLRREAARQRLVRSARRHPQERDRAPRPRLRLVTAR